METKSKIILGSFVGAFLVLTLFLIIPAYNVKSESLTSKDYDPLTKTVFISDLSKEPIVEIQLLTPINNLIFGVGWQRVAEFKINSTIDETVLKSLSQIDFYSKDINGAYIGTEGYYYKYKTTELQEVLKYPNSYCDKLNSSLCLETEFINIEMWNNLTSFDTIPKGVTTIGLYYNVKLNEKIEWIPTYYDTKIEEWASFEAYPREYYTTGEDNQREYWEGYHRAQTFTIGTVGDNFDTNLVNLSVKIYKHGNPTGTCYAELQGVNETNFPNGTTLSIGSVPCSSLTTTPGTFVNHTMSPNYVLEASTQYAIILWSSDCDTNNKPFARRDASSPSYGGGTLWISNDNESTWILKSGEDFLFKVWGTNISAAPVQWNITGILNFSNGTGVSTGDIYAVWQSNNTVAKNTTSNGTGYWNLEAMPNATYIITGYDPTNTSIDGDVEAHVVLGT